MQQRRDQSRRYLHGILLTRTTWGHLTERWQKGHRIKLYALGKFYVEVHYAKGGLMVTEMRSFEKLEFLAPYLDRIELRELIAQ